MTALEILVLILVIIIIAMIVYFFYYFYRGAKGPVSITRPMESRVDEYLDRRFDLLIDEYSLVTKPRLKSFKAVKERPLMEEELKVKSLKEFETEMSETLNEMEKRLDALETESGGS